ncbi:unnamed protein product [Ambrosiozyma monospora]|uniref:Unnamed protein product n=1 Tax=Ambrosiozyma monospora TaxID=43982 RepID=A0A9W7DDL7_AMBMO|nr:unnamed protein product [Ambrosiozyma monospora]
MIYNNIISKTRSTCLLLALLPSITSATLTVGYPLNEQLPDVARVGESYSFTISSQTYQDDDSDIEYSASNLPSWLKFDSSSLTFTGTPQTSDATDSQDFQLIGKAGSGNTLNETYSIVVSSNPGPYLKDPLSSQLSSLGETNGQNGLVLQPNDPFSIKFDKDTFALRSGSSNSSIVDYYGRFANRTSLPAWCTFDADTLTFSGTAPTVNSETAPSQLFELMLIATDYEGYTGAYSNFDIVVGGHSLSTNRTTPVVVNGTAGDSFSVEIPLEDVYLDGSAINSTEIKSIAVNEGPSWASVDDEKVSGTVPKDQTDNSLMNVTISDNYGDSVYINFEIDLLTEIFKVDSLDDVNATRGEFFEYTLQDDDFSDLNGTDLSVTFDDNSWLTYFYTNYTLAGVVPDDFDETKVTVNGTMNSISDSKSFNIKGVNGHFSSSSSASSSSTASSSSVSSTATSTSSSAAAAATSSSGAAAGSSSKGSNKKALAIGLGVGIPCFLLLLALILLFFCGMKRRRNNEKEADEEMNEKGPHKSPSNNTLSAYADNPKGMADFNFNKLDKDSSSSSLTNVDTSAEEIYHDAMFENSSDMLLPTQQDPHVTKSWRKSGLAGKPRDSLTSLATVATNDLLTVKVVDDPQVIRKSQLNLLSMQPTLPEEDLDFHDRSRSGSRSSPQLSNLDPTSPDFKMPNSGSNTQIRSLVNTTGSFHTASPNSNNDNNNLLANTSFSSLDPKSNSNSTGDVNNLITLDSTTSVVAAHTSTPTKSKQLHENNPFKTDADNEKINNYNNNNNNNNNSMRHMPGVSDTSLESDYSSSSVNPKLNVVSNKGKAVMVESGSPRDGFFVHDGGEKSIEGVIVNGSSGSEKSFDAGYL